MDQTQTGGLKGGLANIGRAAADIVHTPRWLAIILVLGLVTCVPILGAVVMYGYLLRWAREAAWRIDGPMRPRVFDNSDGVLYAFGWRAFGLALLYALIPAVVSAALVMGQVGAQIASSSLPAAASAFGTSVPATGVVLDLPGQIVVWVVECLLVPAVWVSIMRMALYRDGGAGLQLGKIFQMIGRDVAGLVPLWLVYCVASALLSFVAGVVQDQLLAMASNTAVDPALLLGFSLIALVASYALQVVSVFLMTLTLRTVGRWTAQFDVAHWGPKEAPLPPKTGGRPGV